MSAFTYEAAKKQVMKTADPVSSAYAGRRTAVATKPIGMSGARTPNCGHGPRDQLADLPRQPAERVLEAAPELLAERDVPEAVPCLGPAVDERCPKDPGPQRQLGIDRRRA